jgi:hypothetical protein
MRYHDGFIRGGRLSPHVCSPTLRVLRTFLNSLPPASQVIPILWTVSDYTLQQSKSTKNNITYNSARALQSAPVAFNTYTLALAHPDTMYTSPDNFIRGAARLSPIDSIMANLTSLGMRRHIGIGTCLSVALTLKHILFNQQFQEQQITGDPDAVAAWQYAYSKCVEIFA